MGQRMEKPVIDGHGESEEHPDEDSNLEPTA